MTLILLICMLALKSYSWTSVVLLSKTSLY